MININKMLLNEITTPSYCYEKKELYNQLEKIKKTFPKEVNILYSIKANPNLYLLNLIKDKVYGFEASSIGEIYLALQANINAQKIVFVGPGKRDEEIKYAIENNILAIVVESQTELNIINEIANKSNKVVKIWLRINPFTKFSKSRIKMGGESKQFGFDEEIVEEKIKYFKNLKNINLCGIHCYNGTQNLDFKSIKNNIENIFDIAYKLSTKQKMDISYVDIGGGLGIPMSLDETELDIDNLYFSLVNIFSQYREKLGDKCKIFVESGRFIVGTCGVFVCKVLDIKNSRGKVFVLVDGGTNCGPNSYTSRNFLRRNFLFSFFCKEKNNQQIKADIVGPLCTPTDFLAQNILIPSKLKKGDYVIIHNAGAYGYSASFKDFLSHPYPAEYLIDEQQIKKIRRRSTLEDLLMLY